MQRVYNFAAGPAVMPAEALTTAAMKCFVMAIRACPSWR